MEVSWGGPPLVVGAMAVLDEEALLALEGHGIGKILKTKLLGSESSRAFWFLRRGSEWRTVKTSDVWKDTWSFYRPPNDRDTRHKSWVQIELTRSTEGTRVSDDIHIQNDPTRSSRFKQMTSTSKSFERDLRVSSTTTRVVSPNTKWVSRPKKTEHDSHVFINESHNLSQYKRVCLYFCNQFNSTLAKEKDNSTGSIVHRQPNQSSNKF